MKFIKISCFLGVTAITSGFLTISVSVGVNSWFNIMRGALSDLGRIGLATAWIFNTGLLITSLIAAAYIHCLINSFKHPLSNIASGIYLVSVAHLTLIAIFPEGTPPHLTISYEFFLMMIITYLTYSLTLWIEGFRKHSLLSFLAFATALTGSISIKWPSTAVLELFNILVMTYWYLLMLQLTIKFINTTNTQASNAKYSSGTFC